MKPEDLLLDDSFLAWYFRSDDQHWSHWEKRRATDPQIRQEMDDAVKMLEALIASNVNVSPHQLKDARVSLIDRIENWEKQQTETPRRPLFRKLLPWMGAAASIVLILFMGWWFTAESGEDVYYADRGSTRQIVLPDGSTVDLNANSKLTTHIVNGKDREVWLDGEAYFTITKQPDGSKFIVHTGDLDVEVLGTEFNVRGLQEKTEVVLESGKVQLHLKEAADMKVIMEPGELAEFSKVSGQLTKRDVNTRIYTSWKEGKIIFENAGASEIAQILRERYHVNVKVEEGSILGEFNGIFPSDDVNVVVTALEKTYPGRIKAQNDTIIIRK